MTSADALLFMLLSFVGGIFLASFFGVSQIILWEVVVLGIFYCFVFFKQKAILIFGLCLIIFGIGLYRASSIQPLEFTQTRSLSLNNVIKENLSPPESSILSALLLGNKQDITREYKEKLNKAGIRHITAISGMHKPITP